MWQRYRRIVRGAALAACAVVAVGVAPGTASADTFPGPPSSYFLDNVNSLLCLSLSGTNTGNSTQQEPCTSVWALWYLNYLGGQSYQVKAYWVNQCLAIGSGSTADGVGVIVWPCDNGPEQTWNLVPVGTNYELVNANSGKCAAIGGAQKNTNAWAIQWTCTGGLEQIWKVIGS